VQRNMPSSRTDPLIRRCESANLTGGEVLRQGETRYHSPRFTGAQLISSRNLGNIKVALSGTNHP